MPPSAGCPEHRALEDFLLGRTPRPEADRVEQHLRGCASCAAVLGTLRVRDGLTEQIRAASSEPDLPVDPSLQRLMDGLCHPASDSNATVGTVGGAAPAAGAPADYSFLRPAEAPGELGRLGPYRILGEVGRGGMGVVFRAEDVRLERVVALKVIRPQEAGHGAARERFLREARATAKVAHDGIVAVYQVDEDRGVLFLAMPLLEGETLAARLQREGRLPATEVVRIGRETAEALAAAHARGLVHRDVKPSNLWLEAPCTSPPCAGGEGRVRGGRVKVLDFGLARPVEDGGSHLTQSGAIVGTPAYMAPEQACGEVADARSDLFSLGCVLYHAACGRPPFHRPDTVATLRSVVFDVAAPPHTVNPDMPPALSALIDRLLAKAPADRPGSAHEVAETLRAIEREAAAETVSLPRAAAPAPATASSQPPRRGRSWMAAATLGAAAALLAGPLILRIKDRDGEVREIELKPGTTLEIIEKPDPAPADRPLADEDRPFAVLGAGGQVREQFQGLHGALTSLNADETIEVRGNGPFTLGSVTLRGKALRLRAAAGYRPQFVLSRTATGYDWFALENVSVEVEGCDFRCGNLRFVSGSGPAWEFRNCRLLGGNVQFLGQYNCPRVRLADCLIAGFVPHGNEGFGPRDCDSSLEMENCIFRTAGYHALQVSDQPAHRWRVSLRRNTLLVSGGLMLALDKKQFARTTVEADENVLQVTGVAPLTYALREGGGWRGRRNLYAGAEPLLTRTAAGGEDFQRGLAAWQKFWGRDEEGGREADWAAFAWDEVRRRGHEPEGVVGALAPLTAAAARQYRLEALGPQWDLVGPGEAYVRALAAAGRAVAKDRLRPRPLPDGAFVVLRGEKEVRGYPTLAEAVAAAADGDAVEVRTDDPIGGGPLTAGPRRLTLRAGPGYRPVIDGPLGFDARGLSLTVEGLHFRKGPLGPDPGPQPADAAAPLRLARLANCSFSSDTTFVGYTGRMALNGVHGGLLRGADGQPVEIVNCLIPGFVTGTLPAGGKLAVRNSVVGSFRLAHGSAGDRSLELDRCVVWNPCGDQPALVVFTADREKAKIGLSVSACRTLFEGPLAYLNQGVELKEWVGAGNLYRVGHRPWLTAGDTPAANGPIGLTDWRLRWQGDADSAEADPLEYDPRQWQLRPGSPGAGQGAGGRDLGADVDRVAAAAR